MRSTHTQVGAGMVCPIGGTQRCGLSEREIVKKNFFGESKPPVSLASLQLVCFLHSFPICTSDPVYMPLLLGFAHQIHWENVSQCHHNLS